MSSTLQSIICIIGFITFTEINYVKSAEVDPSLLDIKEIHDLDDIVSQSYLINHDFLECYADGDFKDMNEATSILASNHFVYSRNFINYLEKVADKIDNEEIKKPILENINEEMGNYEESDINELTKIGIKKEWYNNIQHKNLSQRFFDSLGLIFNDDNNINSKTPGANFTKYMLHLYDDANVCESLAIIGFAIEETVSKIYQHIWNGLKYHTDLTDDQYVFFPLHILLDDGHADLLKLGFKHYLKNNQTLCKNSKNIINDVLIKRSIMYDQVRAEIEEKQGYKCKRPYHHNHQQHHVSDTNNVLTSICMAAIYIILIKCITL